MNNKEIVLEKAFSREKSLAYFLMWDESERMGYKDFLDYDFKNSLFIFDPEKNKVSVWYDNNSLKEAEEILMDKMQKTNVLSDIEERLNEEWKKIYPYLLGEKKIISLGDLDFYCQGVTKWWSAMNTAYLLINNDKLSLEIKNVFLDHRKKTEKYTEKMDQVIINFFVEKTRDESSHYLSIKEIKEGFSESEIKKRKAGWFIFKKNIFLLNELSNVLEKNNIKLKKDIAEKDIIKGSVAYPGIVRGKVRKILLKSDIEKFEDGEILVAEATFPDHVVAMKKAAAFVTDEGGVTCHAAIVAREMKKPCVIGTKIATQALKDEDEVEVDAEKGIIKIIK